VLNVTSQKWLDTSKAIGPNGALWTHQVIVVVPSKVQHKNMSVAYLTGNCNEAPVGIPGKTDEELLLIDTISHDTGVVGIIVYQLPNCHIVYPSDPSKKGRSEDAMIAWVRHYIHPCICTG
jgi:PhoPQ-activated pathogenicity-related protein